MLDSLNQNNVSQKRKVIEDQNREANTHVRVNKKLPDAERKS